VQVNDFAVRKGMLNIFVIHEIAKFLKARITHYAREIPACIRQGFAKFAIYKVGRNLEIAYPS